MKTGLVLGGQVNLPHIQKVGEFDTNRMDQILKSHMIDPRLLHSDDFNSFFIAREAVLLSLIEKAMGKPIARVAGKEELDTTEDESTVEDQS